MLTEPFSSIVVFKPPKWRDHSYPYFAKEKHGGRKAVMEFELKSTWFFGQDAWPLGYGLLELEALKDRLLGFHPQGCKNPASLASAAGDNFQARGVG